MEKHMKFEIPELKYPEDGLTPHISKETVQYHYGKHTKKYYETTNKLITDTVFVKYDSLHELIKNGLVKAETQLFNNACQAFNHTFFWDSLCPEKESSEPSDKLLYLINKNFGSFDSFKEKFNEAASEGFGSYWTWLILHQGDLKIKNMPNAGCPLTTQGMKPLLVIDFWEHSWYLDYPADKSTYTKSIWNIIDWNTVNERFNTSA